MENKILLFEIEKGSLPNLTWTQTDATHNIWTTDLELLYGAQDVNTLEDGGRNGFTKSDVTKNTVILDGDGFTYQSIDLLDSDDTTSEIASKFRNQTYYDWTASGSNNEVIFTATTPGPKNISPSFYCPAGNIQAHTELTTLGVTGSTISNDTVQWTFPVPDEAWYRSFFSDYFDWIKERPVWQPGSYNKDQYVQTGILDISTWKSWKCIKNITPGYEINWKSDILAPIIGIYYTDLPASATDGDYAIAPLSPSWILYYRNKGSWEFVKNLATGDRFIDLTDNKIYTMTSDHAKDSGLVPSQYWGVKTSARYNNGLSTEFESHYIRYDYFHYVFADGAWHKHESLHPELYYAPSEGEYWVEEVVDVTQFNKELNFTIIIRDTIKEFTVPSTYISATLILNRDYTYFPENYFTENWIFPPRNNQTYLQLAIQDAMYQMVVGEYEVGSSSPEHVVLNNATFVGPQRKMTGSNGIIDRSKVEIPLQNPVVTVEGGSQEISPVNEVRKLVIDSYSTNYRLFTYNKSTSKLTIRFPYSTDPNNTTWYTSVRRGFSNYEGWYDPELTGGQIFYESRIVSIPTISHKKDSTYYSVVSFNGGSVTLNNTDGYFDNLDEEDVYGQNVRLRYSADSGATFETIYNGYFESYQLNGIPGQCVVSVYDKRKILSKSLPNNFYNVLDYPYLNTQNNGLPVALGFGHIHRAQAICLNEAETPIPANYLFKVCDNIYPIQSIDQVYFEGDPVTAENIDLTNCTFTLPSTVYVAGKMVTVEYHGYVVDGSLLENPIKILELLLDKYANFSKTSFNYNLEEWNECRDRANLPRVGYHIAESKTMIDIIGEISNSVFGSFLIQKDGLISFKIRDTTKDIIRYIPVSDQIAAPVQNYISSEYVNSLRVGYQKAFSTGKSTHQRFDSKEEELFNKYRVDNEKTVETIISNKADALAYGNSLYQEYAGIFPTFTISTKSDYLGLEIEDLVEVEVYVLPDGSFGTVVLEVLGVDADLNANTVSITGRFVRYGGTYTGKKLIKNISA